MAFMFGARQPQSISTRARTEAYAGLLLLVIGITVLAFNRCPANAGRRAMRPPGTSPRLTGRALPPSVATGSATQDGAPTKGWWVGHFATEEARRTDAVETKWISHKAGARNEGFVSNAVATSMAVLVSGRHRVEFEHSFVVLEYPGDYVIWGPRVGHSWTALDASTMLCVRWPSVRGDQAAGDVRSGNANNGSRADLVTSVRVARGAPLAGAVDRRAASPAGEGGGEGVAERQGETRKPVARERTAAPRLANEGTRSGNMSGAGGPSLQ